MRRTWIDSPSSSSSFSSSSPVSVSSSSSSSSSSSLSSSTLSSSSSSTTTILQNGRYEKDFQVSSGSNCDPCHSLNTSLSIPANTAASATVDNLFSDSGKSILYFSLLVLVWYSSTSLANTSNKSLMNYFPFSLTVTLIQFGFASSFTLIFLHFSGFDPVTFLSIDSVVRKILPLSCGHMITHVLGHITLQSVSISFLQTVKATSPIFSVFLSMIFLRQKFSPNVLVSLIPIIFGVALFSASTLEFDWRSFFTGITATFVLTCQNIYSKKVITEKISAASLFFHASLTSFIVFLPVCLLFDEGLYQIFSSSSHYDFNQLAQLFFTYSICNWTQNIAAFYVISYVSPVTYSVANTLKRVVVIVFSILWFQNSVSFLDFLGIFLALTGVGLYNKAQYEAYCEREREKQKERENQNYSIKLVEV